MPRMHGFEARYGESARRSAHDLLGIITFGDDCGFRCDSELRPCAFAYGGRDKIDKDSHFGWDVVARWIDSVDGKALVAPLWQQFDQCSRLEHWFDGDFKNLRDPPAGHTDAV